MNGNKTKTNGNTRLLPFDVIEAAVNGDVDAINQVLKHYEGYIIALSTRRLYDEDGRAYMVVDTEIRRTLETKLITKILQFDLHRAA
jgi:hypothetical protein